MATKQKWDSETERMARSLDALAEYDEFCHALLPKLRRMVLENWSPDRIRKEVGTYLTARTVSIALSGSKNSASTFRACQDVLDRLEGKPTRRQEVTRQYANMSKAELSALAYQKLVDAGLLTPPKNPNTSAYSSADATNKEG
jgi:hypothetical protein